MHRNPTAHPDRYRGRMLRAGVALLVTLFLLAPASRITYADTTTTAASAPTTVASGLNYPRGLTTGPDGSVYVALAGFGTYTHPSGACGQSPFAGSSTGAGVVKLSGGTQTPVTLNMATSFFSQLGHIGTAGVTFIGSTMYVLQEGGGCQGGVPDKPTGVYKINADGTATLVADLGAYYASHPVKTPDNDDFAPAGNPYEITSMGGSLYVAEANHAEIDKVNPSTGDVTRVLDFSQEPWMGVTGIAAWNGSIYFTDLTEIPFKVGAASIFKLNADGTTTAVATGMTALSGLAIAPDGTMYATEIQTTAGGPTPGSGAVVSVTQKGTVSTIASGLYFPTGITIAPDGGLDVSDYSEAAAPGSGKVLHLAVPGGTPPPTVIATGLDYPRGLATGPDGSLFAALAGSGNTTHPSGPCGQSPFAGAPTGAGVVKVSGGTGTPVTLNLATSFLQPLGHIGAAAVAFIGNKMYVLEEGGACQGGVPDKPNGIYQVAADGTLTLVADLGAYWAANPVKTPDMSDFVPQGNAYAMTAMGGALYVAEANHEEIDKVDPATGAVTRLVDFSQEPWLGPTGIVAWNGSIYFADLTEFPVVPGAAGIFRVNADGTTTKVVSGLTAVTGLAVASDGTMYATEVATAAGNLAPGTGAVVRISPSGTITQVASGLYFPTGITVAPDGGLDVSDYSEATAPHTGVILHIAGPSPAGVLLQSVAGGVSPSFTVSFASALPGNGAVYFGAGPGCTGLVEVATQDQGAGTTTHTVMVTGNDLPGTVGNNGLVPGTTYWFEVVTSGATGSQTDNNGGACYSVTIPKM